MLKFFEKDDLDRCKTARSVVAKAVELELDDDDLVPYMLARKWTKKQIDHAYCSVCTGVTGSVCKWVGI